MAIEKNQLIQVILDFMTVIHECYSDTNFANDRSVYAQDLLEAMEWIIELRSGKCIEDVVDKISGPETEKHFGDYWRQGNWGEKEGAALKKLKSSI